LKLTVTVATQRFKRFETRTAAVICNLRKDVRQVILVDITTVKIERCKKSEKQAGLQWRQTQDALR
jgi:hypothetical protein